MLVWVPRRL